MSPNGLWRSHTISRIVCTASHARACSNSERHSAANSVLVEHERAAVRVHEYIQLQVFSRDLRVLDDGRARDVAVPAFELAIVDILHAEDIEIAIAVKPLAEAVASAQVDVTQINIIQSEARLNANVRLAAFDQNALIGQDVIAARIALDHGERRHGARPRVWISSSRPLSNSIVARSPLMTLLMPRAGPKGSVSPRKGYSRFVVMMPRTESASGISEIVSPVLPQMSCEPGRRSRRDVSPSTISIGIPRNSGRANEG